MRADGTTRSGAQFVTRGHMFRTYDWDNATGLVDDLLGRYGLPGDAGKRATAE